MAIITENNGDAGADPADTSYSIALGDVFQGTLGSAGDTDLVQVELAANTIYDFALSSPETLNIALVDSAGNQVAGGVLNSSGARIIISPPASGTYYIKIYNRAGDSSGDYEVSFSENTIPVGTYDDIAAYLVSGYWDGNSYAFDVGPGGVLTADVTALSEENRQLARWALEAWTNVTGIRFELIDEGDADLTFYRQEGGISSGGFVLDSDGVIVSGHVNFSTEDGSLGITRSLNVLIHEIGHTLGLGHPGPYPRDYENPGADFGVDNVFLLDSWQASVMSYIHQSRSTWIDASQTTPFTPMIADIIAIQHLYGVPEDANAGDTVYGYDANLDGYLGQVFSWWTGADNPFAAVDGTTYGYPALVDLDGDGDTDLIIGNNHLNSDGTDYDAYSVDYYENTGTAAKPVFRQRTGVDNPLDGAESFVEFKPVLADLDGDSDLDLLIGNLYYYENTGTATAPAFTQRTGAGNPLSGIRDEHYKRVVLPDLDADGDFDLVAVNGEGGLLYFENTGTAAAPVFTQRSGADNPFANIDIEKDDYGTGSPAFVDLDADGDPDLVIGTIAGKFDYYENTGTAMAPAYTQRTGVDNPFIELTSTHRLNPEFTDIDNDGDPDLVTGDFWGKVHFYENTGTANSPLFTAPGTIGDLALTLYDNSGNDTLDLRNDTRDQQVSLQPEGISDVYGLTGNLVIARDTVIENFVAGSGNDTVAGNAAANYLQGNDGNDGLWGSAGDDILEGGAGADRLHGGAGLDRVSYRGSDAAVTVNLVDATVSGGHADGDVITGIEGAIGSDYDDVLQGNDAANRFEGGAGADQLDGGAGDDWLSYRGSNAGVTVNLGDHTVSGGHAEGDTITGFEHVTGSAFQDTLIGNAEDNRLVGGAGADDLRGNGGNDSLEGSAGADTLDGGTGTDRATYAGSDTGVSVDLKNGTAEYGHAQGDVFTGIENLGGSAFGDILAGDDNVNVLEGEDGDDELQGNAGDDVLKGGAGADKLDGGSDNDELAGDTGDDILQGGAGADRLDGGIGEDWASYSGSGSGVTVDLGEGTGVGGHAQGDVITNIENLLGSAYADVLVGDDVGNLLEGEEGDDELRGNGGDDVLKGGAGADELDGGDDDDELSGDAGDDILKGNAGSDRLYGDTGADELDGGSGIDWVSYVESDAGVTVDLADGTGAGGYAQGDTISNAENVMGTGYADVLRGDGNANVLHGLDGDDDLRGNGGNDVLEGGVGADTLDGGPGTDRASYRDSDAGITINLADGTSEGGHAEDDVITAIENVTGSGYDDVITGDGSANQLQGGSGNDQLRGAGGADRLDGGDGTDWIYYWGSAAGITLNLEDGTGKGGNAEGDVIAGVENVMGSRHADILIGDTHNNYLDGLEGDDDLRGNDGDDWMEGRAGADKLDGGDGDDWASYWSSDAGVTVNLADATSAGGHAEGDAIVNVENIRGSDHADTLTGDDAANSLRGLDGDDDLRGNAGDDVLYGEAGADRLEGGAGTDRLYGNTGSLGDESTDTYVFAAAHGDDYIYGFANNEDKIDLSAFDLAGFDDLTITSTSYSVTIDLTEHGGGTIQLQDFDIANLDTTDFLF